MEGNKKLHTLIKYKKIRQQLRNNSTHAERVFWKNIKKSQLGGFKFRRQHSIGPYIVDFYCPEVHVVVELDGWIHGEDGVKEKDTERQKFLETNGFFVVRYRNEQIKYELKLCWKIC